MGSERALPSSPAPARWVHHLRDVEGVVGPNLSHPPSKIIRV